MGRTTSTATHRRTIGQSHSCAQPHAAGAQAHEHQLAARSPSHTHLHEHLRRELHRELLEVGRAVAAERADRLGHFHPVANGAAERLVHRGDEGRGWLAITFAGGDHRAR